MSVSSAAASGDRKATLEAMRDALARVMDTAESPMAVASASRQLQEVLAQIAELTPPDVEGTPLDEFQRDLGEKRDGTG